MDALRELLDSANDEAAIARGALIRARVRIRRTVFDEATRSYVPFEREPGSYLGGQYGGSSALAKWLLADSPGSWARLVEGEFPPDPAEIDALFDGEEGHKRNVEIHAGRLQDSYREWAKSQATLAGNLVAAIRSAEDAEARLRERGLTPKLPWPAVPSILPPVPGFALTTPYPPLAAAPKEDN